MEKTKAIPNFSRILLWLLFVVLVWLAITVLFPRMLPEVMNTSSITNQRG